MAAAAGDPSSYMALAPGTPVLSSEGRRIGTVAHVLADTEEDIFDGVVIDAAWDAGHVFADAEQVGEIRTDAVVLRLDEEAARSLPQPSENPAAVGVDPDDTVKGGPGEALRDKLRRAWDLVSGNY